MIYCLFLCLLSLTEAQNNSTEGLTSTSLPLGSTYSSVQTVQPEWSLSEYPNPMLDPAACGRDPEEPGYLCDPNGIITKYQGNELNTKAKVPIK